MAKPKSRPIQISLDFGPPADGNASPYPWHHYEVRARAEINALIEEMHLDADEIVSDAMVLAWMSDMSDESETNDILLAAYLSTEIRPMRLTQIPLLALLALSACGGLSDGAYRDADRK